MAHYFRGHGGGGFSLLSQRLEMAYWDKWLNEKEAWSSLERVANTVESMHYALKPDEAEAFFNEIP